MESDTEPDPPPSPPDAPCCPCGCGRCHLSAWQRSVKRRLPGTSETGDGPRFDDAVAARVDVETEAAALREAVAGHRKTVSDLVVELEEERSASASAAEEAMSMILRLQREKAEVQMEARQFKRFAEEKMAHDQRELLVLEDLLYKREQALQALSCEVKAYRHRLLSYGVDPDSIVVADGEEYGCPDTFGCDDPSYPYPSLTCHVGSQRLAPNIDDEIDADVDQLRLRSLEWRIHELERMPSQVKGVVVGQSPKAKVPTYNGKQQEEEFPVVFDGSSELGGDDDNTSDRVYTIDAVHVGTPRESKACRMAEEADIKKLYVRLQALEADRESMRQAIMSMRTDKAQLVLLKEIAQQLCRESTEGSLPPPPPPMRKVVRKPSFLSRFSFMSAIKWVLSLVFWRKPPRRSKYMFELSNGRVGLLLLLEKASQMQQQRRLSRI